MRAPNAYLCRFVETISIVHQPIADSEKKNHWCLCMTNNQGFISNLLIKRSIHKWLFVTSRYISNTDQKFIIITLLNFLCNFSAMLYRGIYVLFVILKNFSHVINRQNNVPSLCRFTVHTAFGEPGNSDTAISATSKPCLSALMEDRGPRPQARYT